MMKKGNERGDRRAYFTRRRGKTELFKLFNRRDRREHNRRAKEKRRNFNREICERREKQKDEEISRGGSARQIRHQEKFRADTNLILSHGLNTD